MYIGNVDDGCCFSPSSGLSIYIDGVLVRSQAKFQQSHFTTGSVHPLCIGSCATAVHNANHNVTLSWMKFIGASIHDLRRNNLLDILGGPFYLKTVEELQFVHCVKMHSQSYLRCKLFLIRKMILIQTLYSCLKCLSS